MIFAENEVEFMTDAMDGHGVYQTILDFYSDICHLLFGLGKDYYFLQK